MTDKRHLVREHSAAKVSSILNTSCPLSSNCLMGSNMVRSGGHKGGHGARARRRNIRTIRAINLQGARVSAATKAPAHSCLNPAVSPFFPSPKIPAAAVFAPDRDNNAKAIVALDAYVRHLEHGMVARLQTLETPVPSSQQKQQSEPQQQSSPPQPYVLSTVVARLQALEDIVFSTPHPQPPSPPTVTTGLQQPRFL